MHTDYVVSKYLSIVDALFFLALFERKKNSSFTDTFQTLGCKLAILPVCQFALFLTQEATPIL